MSNSLGICPLIFAGLVAAWPANTAGGAGTIVTTAGFEGPAFSAGNLIGQQGWVAAGSGSSVAAVQDSVFDAGSQALRVERVGDSDRRWAMPVSGFPTGRFVSIAWDMAVTVTQKPGIFGPFFGVEAYDGTDGLQLQVFGSLGVDATTGEVLIQAAGTGVLVAPGPVVGSNDWNHFEIELDFLTETYNTYLNGALLDSTGFVDAAFGLDEFTDADIGTFAASFDGGSLNESGTAWFDNFIVIDGIPGDFDGDGFVGAADYVVWRNTEGDTGVDATADGNGDGVVDNTDYDLWVDNFGRSNRFPSAGNGAAAVPEPQTAVLLLAVLLGTARQLSRSDAATKSRQHDANCRVFGRIKP